MPRPPVSQNWDFFKRDWTVWDESYQFSYDRGSYLHSGTDFNRSSGGDTDLGEPLYAVLPGKIVYYHLNSHPTTSYGRHLVYRVETGNGTRWIMYAHCQEKDFLAGVQDVSEGQMIARVGKSGTNFAHLHMTVFKKDPTTLVNKIDHVFKDYNLLLEYCEDPEEFLSNIEGGSMSDELTTCLKDREMFWNQRDELYRALGVGNQQEALAEIKRLQEFEAKWKDHKCPDPIVPVVDGFNEFIEVGKTILRINGISGDKANYAVWQQKD